jgi:putative transposase
MEFFANELYHIYNRGNNKQKIFFSPDNYIYFLKKVEAHIHPCCSILAYCLMPNHFHFLVHSDKRTTVTKLIGDKERNILSEGIRNTLSSYTQAINKQNNSTGSLFQQNTKARPMVKGGKNYDFTCLHYIHQNPVTAKLVTKMEDWPYSSFIDYCGLRNGTLCNRELAIQLLDLRMESFYEDSYKMIGIDVIRNIF